MEETKEKDESIHSEVEVVKQQLEAHKVRVTASSSNYSAPVPYPFLSLGSNHIQISTGVHYITWQWEYPVNDIVRTLTGILNHSQPA